MINLRYHIVSITAVFLALGIGITMGSTFLGRTALDRIDANVDRARRERNEVRADNARLRESVSTFEERRRALSEEGAEQMFEGRLEDVPVLLITAPGVDQDSLDQLQIALRGSGAGLLGSLVVSNKLALDGGDAAELAEVLDVSTDDPDQLRRIVTTRLATELMDASEADAPTPTSTTRVTTTTMPFETPGSTAGTSTTEITTTTTEPEMATETVGSLIEAGFLDFQAPSDGAALTLASESRYVVVTGADPDVADSIFLQPLLKEMAEDQPAPVVLATAATGEDPEAVREVPLEPYKQDESIAERISSVNDLEEFSGVAAVILALDDLGAGRHGHYGLGDAVGSLLPNDEGG
ncbi:MAG: copper transporter [Acidimicrobiales bacterium]